MCLPEGAPVFARVKFTALVAVVAGAVLLPLYGDPRNAPVTHPEWARMLLRVMGLEDAVPQGANATQVFAVLSWKNTLSFRADRYIKGDNVEVLGSGDQRRVRAEGGVAELVYPVAVTQKGDYRVRARLAGDPNQPAALELARPGETKVVKAFTLTPSTISGWVDGGVTHLDAGPYLASVLLPPGTVLEQVEVAPPCVAAIE